MTLQKFMTGAISLTGLLALSVLIVLPTAQAQSAVTIEYDVWTDADRGRDIPIKLYIPEGGEAIGVLVFSHGLGGSREAAAYLGERAAQDGFLGLFIQHPGSDESVWRDRPRGQRRQALVRAANAQTAIARFMDLPFVLDELEARVERGEIRADTSRIAIAGHSYGSHSALAAVGRGYDTPRGLISFADPRVRAAVALSPPPFDAGESARFDAIFGSIDRPVMHITGTEDGDPLRDTASPEARLVAFAEISGPPQYLIVFEDGDHMVFSGREGMSARNQTGASWYPDVQADVADLTMLFLQTHLLADAEAAARLASDDLAGTLRHPARVERKDLTPDAGH